MRDQSRYLLSVAEKIMQATADIDTLQKYYKLKERMLQMFGGTRSETIRISRSSVRLSSEGIFKQNTSLAKQKMGKRKRIATVTAPASAANCGQTVLSQLSALLSEAETNPNILSTVKLLDRLELSCAGGLHIQNIINQIQKSLTRIGDKFEQRPLQNNVQMKTIETQTNAMQVPRCPEVSQVVKDNKWLLCKMEALVQQNLVLRRMVGHQRGTL